MSNRILVLGSALMLAGCSAAETQVDGFVVGNYQVTGLRVLPNGLGDNRNYTFHFSQVSATSISLEITAGDASHALPAPVTATFASGSYTMQWTGGAQFNHTIVFRTGSCEGSDTDGGGGVVAWSNCSIRAVP